MKNLISRADAVIASLIEPELFNSIALLSWKETISKGKSNAVELLELDEAKKYWICEAIVKSHLLFQDAFNKIKQGEYYKAWCMLEQCELIISALEKHHVLSTDDPHHLLYVKEMVSKWQAMFPYSVFFSPEFLKRKVTCSTCGALIKPRSQCGHKKGEIYNGEMCTHIVEKCDLISISVVKDPVQKYSVAFLSSEKSGEPVDHYDYSNLKFIVDRLESPYHKWIHLVTQRRIMRHEVSHLTPDSKCPCLSGNDFGKCCESKDEILVPHLQIEFSVAPRVEFPTDEFLF
jgi:hypothetical protein